MPSSRSLRPRCRTGLATPCRGPTTGRTSWTGGVPLMAAWANYVTGSDASNVVPFGSGSPSPSRRSRRLPGRCRWARWRSSPTTKERGERTVGLEAAMVDRLRAMRGPGESYSDVILRIAGQEALATRRG